MNRPTLLGGILAVILAPMSMGINSFLSPTPKQDTRLADSLTSLSATLASFEQRQTGSETELTKQLASLAGIVADTQRANQQQIEQLSKSLTDVRLVAMQAGDKSAFTDLLKNFGTDLEKRLDTKVQTLVQAESEDAKDSVVIQADILKKSLESYMKDKLSKPGVGTLDVNSKPEADDGRPEDFADAARRIVALEKEVAALKARSSVSSTASSTYYPATTVSSSSGGSTGSFAGGSTGVSYGYSSPTYSYTQPVYTYAAQPVQTYYPQATVQYAAPQATVRRGWFGRQYSSAPTGTCRIVNGQVVCN